MKRTFLLCLLLLWASPVWAQQTPAAVTAGLSSATCPGSGCLALSATGWGSMAVQVSGTFTGTITFEASLDNVSFSALNCYPSNSSTVVTTATSAGLWNAPVGGFAWVRARMSSYTSGTATVTIQPAAAGGTNHNAVGAAAAGTLTGTTLAANVVTSSLTSFGTVSTAGSITTTNSLTGAQLAVTGGSSAAGTINISATLGMVVRGKVGSATDLALQDATGGTVFQVLTGSQNMQMPNLGSSAGTAIVADGSGTLFKLSSSARYKTPATSWAVSSDQLAAFVALSPRLWDYTGQQTGAGGFIAEDLAALGLTNAYGRSPLVNYDLQGRPDSNRDFAVIGLQHFVLQNHDARLAALEAEIAALKTLRVVDTIKPNVMRYAYQ